MVFIQDVIIYLNLLNSEVRLTKWPLASSQVVFYSVVLCDGCSRSQPPPLIHNINGFEMFLNALAHYYNMKYLLLYRFTNFAKDEWVGGSLILKISDQILK